MQWYSWHTLPDKSRLSTPNLWVWYGCRGIDREPPDPIALLPLLNVCWLTPYVSLTVTYKHKKYKLQICIKQFLTSMPARLCIDTTWPGYLRNATTCNWYHNQIHLPKKYTTHPVTCSQTHPKKTLIWHMNMCRNKMEFKTWLYNKTLQN